MQPRFGKYRMERKIAVGGMAEIYLAYTGNNQPVAIKKIHPNLASEPKFIQMFLDEARIIVGLKHPNIVQLLDFGKSESTYFLVMEWINGKSLSEIVARQVQCRMEAPVDVSLMMILDVCKGLGYAHEKRDRFDRSLGLIHRDISPPNIMVTREGVTKLADFGIAYMHGKSLQTQPGIIRGKFSYMSPEQTMGQDLDRRSDIFSLGVVLYEMLTSTRLFLRDREQDTLDAVRKCVVPSITKFRKDISPTLELVIQKALLPIPSLRYQDTREFRAALQAVLIQEYSSPNRNSIIQFLHTLFPDEFFECNPSNKAMSLTYHITSLTHPLPITLCDIALMHPFSVSLGFGVFCILLVEVVIYFF